MKNREWPKMFTMKVMRSRNDVYTDDFRRQAIFLVREIGLADAAQQLSVSEETLSEWEKDKSRNILSLKRFLDKYFTFAPKICFIGLFIIGISCVFFTAAWAFIRITGISFVTLTLTKAVYFLVILGILTVQLGILTGWGEILMAIVKKMWPGISKTWPEFPITIIFNRTGKIKKFKRASDLSNEIAYLSTDNSEDVIVMDSKNRKVCLSINSFKIYKCELL